MNHVQINFVEVRQVSKSLEKYEGFNQFAQTQNPYQV